MSLEQVEEAISDRYSLHGYSISRKNTKTIVVELPYGVQDFDQFVMDMRLTYGCKIDYDLSEESTSKSIEIRLTPGTHEILNEDDSGDEYLNDNCTLDRPPRASCGKTIVLLGAVLAVIVALFVFIDVALYSKNLSQPE